MNDKEMQIKFYNTSELDLETIFPLRPSDFKAIWQ